MTGHIKVYTRGLYHPRHFIEKGSYPESRVYCAKLPSFRASISHAPEQPLNAAALHNDAPTGNQTDQPHDSEDENRQKE